LIHQASTSRHPPKLQQADCLRIFSKQGQKKYTANHVFYLTLGWQMLVANGDPFIIILTCTEPQLEAEDKLARNDFLGIIT
jgi:hypothetical protein